MFFSTFGWSFFIVKSEGRISGFIYHENWNNFYQMPFNFILHKTQIEFDSRTATVYDIVAYSNNLAVVF